LLKTIHQEASMNNTRRSITLPAAAMLALVSSLTLSACNRADDDRTAGQKLDSAIAKTDQRADETKQATENAADRAAGRVESATDQMSAKADDISVTAKVNAALAGDPKLSALKINVDTTQGHVSLSGTAPDAASRDRATELARSVKGVVSVDNRLEVRG
jgi:hyperosmotically inducible periplasmic protein